MHAPRTRQAGRRIVRTLAYTWAAPTTLIGLVAGAMTLATGGRVQRRRGALEFHGGFSRWLADRWCFRAMTLGHVILGTDAATLDCARSHEQVHVRQYELWGPLFLPAYALSSLWQLACGRRCYRDNWFERQAFERS